MSVSAFNCGNKRKGFKEFHHAYTVITLKGKVTSSKSFQIAYFNKKSAETRKRRTIVSKGCPKRNPIQLNKQHLHSCIFLPRVPIHEKTCLLAATETKQKEKNDP